MRTLAILLLGLMQLISPALHAHVGGQHEAPALHLHLTGDDWVGPGAHGEGASACGSGVLLESQHHTGLEVHVSIALRANDAPRLADYEVPASPDVAPPPAATRVDILAMSVVPVAAAAPPRFTHQPHRAQPRAPPR